VDVQVRAAIVTCGGLCPGLNDVIRQVIFSLLNLPDMIITLGSLGFRSVSLT
jgi:6-phosphofructokinase